MKVAIRYQSRGGNVKAMAEALARGCGAEAIPINSPKAKIKELFGDEFFTDQSPIWLSQRTGGCMFLSDWQGGVIEVKLEKIG